MQHDPMTAYPGLSTEDAPDIRGARLYSPPRHHAIWQEYPVNGKSAFGESLMVG